MAASGSKRSKKARSSAADRTSLLSPQERGLHSLLTQLEATPPEIISRVLDNLPLRSRCAMRYAKGNIAEEASASVHRGLAIAYYVSRDLSVLPSLCVRHGHCVRSLDMCLGPYPKSIDLNAMLEHLPTLCRVDLHCGGSYPIHQRLQLSNLAWQPRLTDLNIQMWSCATGDALEPLGTATCLPPLAAKRRGESSREEEGLVADSQNQDATFPALTRLSLGSHDKRLHQWFFGRKRRAGVVRRSQLSHFELVKALYSIPTKTFPTVLSSLRLIGCRGLSWNQALQIVALSSSSLTGLWLSIGQSPSLHLHFLSPVVPCPRLRVLQLDTYPPGIRYGVEPASENESHGTPDWTRTAIGCHSRIIAPSLEVLGLGLILLDEETTEEGIMDLISTRNCSTLKHVVAANYEPPAFAHFNQSAEQALVQRNAAICQEALSRYGDLRLSCLGEDECREFMQDQMRILAG